MSALSKLIKNISSPAAAEPAPEPLPVPAPIVDAATAEGLRQILINQERTQAAFLELYDELREANGRAISRNNELSNQIKVTNEHVKLTADELRRGIRNQAADLIALRQLILNGSVVPEFNALRVAFGKEVNAVLDRIYQEPPVADQDANRYKTRQEAMQAGRQYVIAQIRAALDQALAEPVEAWEAPNPHKRTIEDLEITDPNKPQVYYQNPKQER